ncbi:hypothetical protein DWY34_16635 [Blautia sp. AF25-12LB]|nr:hypothetical protein DWY34_16635 [Blautia sp. AF25-12LB]
MRESRANKIPSAPTGKESPLIRKNKESVPAVMDAVLNPFPRFGGRVIRCSSSCQEPGFGC